MKIVILDGYAANPGDLSWDGWNNLGHTVERYDRTMPEEALERCADAEIVITNKVVFTRELISKLPKLRYLGVTATGYNIIDTEAAHERGITVTNIPAYSTDSVAQMVFAHILNITNNVGDHDRAVDAGRWQNSEDFCFWLTPQTEIAGKTIGIVGLGNTGMKTALIAMAFGMKVLALTSKDADAVPQGIAKAESLEALLRSSDIVSLHCPLTPDTQHIINRETLSQMHPSAILINTGRGPLIDEEALAQALKSGSIRAAGLDVLSEEAPRHGSPLIGLANCHITPHIAWATTEARTRLMDITLENVKAFLAGHPQNVV